MGRKTTRLRKEAEDQFIFKENTEQQISQKRIDSSGNICDMWKGMKQATGWKTNIHKRIRD